MFHTFSMGFYVARRREGRLRWGATLSTMKSHSVEVATTGEKVSGRSDSRSWWYRSEFIVALYTVDLPPNQRTQQEIANCPFAAKLAKLWRNFLISYSERIQSRRRPYAVQLKPRQTKQPVSTAKYSNSKVSSPNLIGSFCVSLTIQHWKALLTFLDRNISFGRQFVRNYGGVSKKRTNNFLVRIRACLRDFHTVFWALASIQMLDFVFATKLLLCSPLICLRLYSLLRVSPSFFIVQ